jgi:hypothetical protein
MKKLRIVIEVDVSSWTPEQIAEYQRLLQQELDYRYSGDTYTLTYESGKKVEAIQ